MAYKEAEQPKPITPRGERRVFLFIAVFLFPALSIVLVGGYGFIVWALQMIFGPPTGG